MNFHDVILPNSISKFAIGSSEFLTSCASSMSGREVRHSDNLMPKRRYFLKDARLSKKQFELLNSFFKARAGKRFSFLIKDHFDYKVNKQLIFTGNGKSQEFQLKKTYEDSLSPFVRNITKPSIKTIKFWQNEIEVFAEFVDKNNGTVKFSEIIEDGQKIYASFNFYVAVRFVNDNLQYSSNDDGTIMIDNAELIEVYE